MKIALLGYGVEGESAYKYYSRIQPDAEFVVYDNASMSKHDIPDGIKFIGEVESFHDVDADIVVKTPAIVPSQVSSRGEITSVTREFFDKCPAQIIGVTGTKGKGTTCTLIAKILKASGKKVWLVGNIGTPALDILDELKPEDIVVYELSSFQLWDLKKSPHIAVVLMIEPEHMDVHENLEDYIGAKNNITAYQNPDDVAIYYDQNDTSRQIAELSSGKKIPYHIETGDDIVVNSQKIIAKNEVGLIGQHNLENIYGAINASWQITQNVDAIASAIRDFKGLPHRLEFVREVDGVKYYDDSISTTPSSAIAALNSFEQPKVIILGGRSKGADFSELALALVRADVQAILIGAEAKTIAQSCKNAGFSNFEILGSTNMSEIVTQAGSIAKEGSIVLLSPACSSVGMFKNYEDRGDQFKTAVKKTLNI